MSTTFETGAVFRLVDEGSPVLRELFAQFDKLDLKVKALQARLEKIVPSGFAASLRGASAEFDSLMASADKTATGIAAAMERAGGSMDALGGAADKASGSVVAAMSTMEKGVVEQLDLVKASSAGVFGDMARAAEAASTSVVASMSRAAAAAKTPLAGVRSTVAESAVAGREMQAASVIGSRLPGSEQGFGRARNHGGGLHLQSSMPLGIEGVHARASSGAGMAGLGVAGLLGLGVYEAAEADDVIAKAGITGQLDMGGDFQNSPQAKSMRELMQKTASMSGYSLKEAGEAILGVERMMGGLNFDTRLQTMNTLLPIAASEAKLKETSLEESFKALVGLAHQTGEYNPEKLKDLAKQFSFASLVTDASLPQLERTLSYSLPVLHAGLDMDPRSIMMLTVMAQNAGITSTKSGTWLRSFFQQSEPGEGTTLSVKKHNAALRDLGMLDDENRVTWRKTGADGKIDWTASVLNVSKILGEHIRALPIDERLQKLHTAFGERGGSFASLMGIEKFVEQMPIIAGKMQNYKGGENALEDYSKNSVAQKARETWRDFENLLMDIGEKALPPLNVALRDLDTVLKQLPQDWESTRKLWSDRMSSVDQTVKKFAPPQLPGPKGPAPGPDDGVGGAMDQVEGFRHNMSYRSDDPFGTSGIEQATERGAWLGVMMGLKNLPGLSALGDVSSGSGFMKTSYEGSGPGFSAGLGGFSRGGGGGSWSASGSGGVPTTFDKTLPPEARALLDTLAGGESPGYDVMNGGARFSDYSQHPGHRAAGRYQDLPSTWRDIVSATGLKDFSPNSQDLGNWWLAKRDYHASTGRDLLTDLKAGDLANVARGLRGTWPSLPGGSQQNTGGDVFLNRWKNNLSKEMGANALPGAPTLDKYMSPNGIITDADMARYNRDRAAYLAKTAPTVSAPPPPPRRGPIEPSNIQAMNMPPVEVHLHSYMDTKKVAHAVTKVQVAENRHHRSVGGMDGYGSHLPPGGDVADSA